MPFKRSLQITSKHAATLLIHNDTKLRTNGILEMHTAEFIGTWISEFVLLH